MNETAEDREQPAAVGNAFHGDLRADGESILNAVGGSQYNLYYTVSALKRRTRYTTERADLDHDLRAVVPPPDFDRHLAAVRATRLLVLTGAADTGLSTAARYRWGGVAAAEGVAADELFVSDSEELTEAIGHLRAPTALFLDISHDDVLGPELPELLRELQAGLRTRQSHLVIALADRYRDAAAQAMPNAVFTIGRPDADQVLDMHLRRDEPARRLRMDPRFRALLADAWPPRIRRIAEFLDAASPDTDADELLAQLHQHLDDWSADLRRRFENEITTARARALMVATSALEGADRAVIAFAAEDFVERSGTERSADPLLEDQSLHQKFSEIGHVVPDGGSTFAKHKYGEAVLTFVWREYPSWRETIRHWFDVLLEPQRLDDDSLARLLSRLIHLATNAPDAGLITERAAHIVSGPHRGAQHRQLASRLLLVGAIDPVIGQEVRRRLWRWAYHRTTPVALQRTVAETCGDPDYARRFPRNACTRVKHLLRSETTSVGQAASEAVVTMARHLPPQILFEQLNEWAALDHDPRIRAAVPGLVVAVLADPQARDWLNSHSKWLADDVEGDVTGLWSSLLLHADPSAVREAVAAWLTMAATAPPDDRPGLIGLLVAAAAEDFWRFGQLAQAAAPFAWAARDRDDGVEDLRRHLHHQLTHVKAVL